MPQLLPEHTAAPLAGTGHTMPQPPQLFLSLVVSTQVVPHFVGVGDVQLMPQTLELQVAVPVPAVGPGHTLVQLPQWLGSVLKRKHWLPHFV